MGIDLKTAQAHLNMWLDAEEKVSRGQSYSTGNRTLTRANLAEIRDSIIFWEQKVAAIESGGGIRLHGFVPVDD